MLKKIFLYLQIARFRSFSISIISYITAVLVALKFQSSPINIYLIILGLIGVILAHFSFNIIDDYFDFKNESHVLRKQLKDGGMRARMKKCFYIEENLVSWKNVIFFVFSMLSVCFIIALISAYYTSPKILIIPIIAGVLSYFYSADPIKLSYRGLGEIAIAIIFGPLIVFGASYLTIMTINLPIILISVILGILTMNVIYIHSIMDYNSDKNARKKTLAVLLGSQKRALILFFVTNFSVYLITILGVYKNIFPKTVLITLLTLPLAIRLCILMFKLVLEPSTKKIKRDIFMGPVFNWEGTKDKSLDWFMIRWCMASNLLMFYSILFIIGYYINK